MTMIARARVATLLLLLLAGPLGASAREIVDMAGRTVTVPEHVRKVVALSPPATYLTYAIDPSLVGGLNFPLFQRERRYMAESYKQLPVIGGRVGEGRNINREMLLRVKPDVVLGWTFGATPDAIDGEYESLLRPLGFPLAYVRGGSVRELPAALAFVGDLLGRRERGDELRRYAEGVLARLDAAFGALPDRERVPVYYAEGADGLATEGEGSMHSQLIPIAGGRNVRSRALQVTGNGMERISLEQLYLYDPEVILVKEAEARDLMLSDPRYRPLRAVRSRRVLLIPGVPFNWFDRPPSFMRLLGAQWLAQQLHPERFPVDMVLETRRFYRLFLGVELSEAEARALLDGGGA